MKNHWEADASHAFSGLLIATANYFTYTITRRYVHPQEEAVEMAFARLDLPQGLPQVTEGSHKLATVAKRAFAAKFEKSP